MIAFNVINAENLSKSTDVSQLTPPNISHINTPVISITESTCRRIHEGSLMQVGHTTDKQM